MEINELDILKIQQINEVWVLNIGMDFKSVYQSLALGWNLHD